MLEGQASRLEWCWVRIRGMRWISIIESGIWMGRIYGWIWLVQTVGCVWLVVLHVIW